MSGRIQDLATLTELIYDAAVEPNRWQDFAALLSECCGGAAVSIGLQLLGEGTPSFAFCHRLDPKLSNVLSRLLQRGTPWTSPLDPRVLEQFTLVSDNIGRDEIIETDSYRQYMRPQSLAPEGPLCYAISHSGGRPTSGVVIYRREGDRALGQQDVELCNALRPHLDRGFKILHHLHGEREQRRALAEVIDCFPMGVLLLDARGFCLSVNASADRILGLDDGVALSHDRPTFSSERRNDDFGEAIALAAAEAVRGAGKTTGMHAIAVERPSGGPAFSMIVTPLLEAGGRAVRGDAVAAVFIADPNAGSLNVQALQDLYSLTPAEAELVSQLVTRRSIDEIAASRGIQTSTARGYLKNAYQKTRTNSQRELVKLILNGIGPMAESKAKAPRRSSRSLLQRSAT